MRRYISVYLCFLVVSFFSLFALPAMAQTGDGITPAVENACDGLKAPGITKGLYGLCVAYCEAEASSESVLRNYNRKKKETDPEMPCLEVVVACPCWDTDTLAGAEGPQSCTASDSGINSSEYSDFSLFFLVPASAGPAACASFAAGEAKEDQALTDDEYASCLESLAASQAIDFPDGCQ